MKLLLFFILSSFVCYAQDKDEVFFFKDLENSLTIDNVKEYEFSLLEEQIIDGNNNATYWFKIPAYKTDLNYIFRVKSIKVNDIEVYQNSNKIKKLRNQRHPSFRFSRDYEVFIKVKPNLGSYLPIEFGNENESIFKEKNELVINSFYYGFALLIIVYNFFYFYLFKDNSFLYYSFFLISVNFSLFYIDGMLSFYNVNESLSLFLKIINYIFISFFFSKFAYSYLQLDYYFPKLKKISYVVGLLIVLFVLLYLTYREYNYLILLNVLFFLLFLAFWFVSVLLFNKNNFIKIFTFAYVIILFAGIDLFVLKVLGISIGKINATNIKAGVLFEMIILSFGVLYRVKILKDENLQMRKEIVNYSKQLDNLTLNESQDNNYSIVELSTRERQVFNLIILGKSNKEIAIEISVSVNTVKFHVKNIYEKLNIKSRKEALKYKTINNLIK